MSHTLLTIERCMSSVLLVAGPKDTIAEAARRMRLHGIRHLPVVSEGLVVGILSQRDVYLIETLADVDPGRTLVEEAMSPDPYVVDPEQPLVSVLDHMAEGRLGSAVVAHEGHLLGLFTTTDALRTLSALLRDREAGASARSPG